MVEWKEDSLGRQTGVWIVAPLFGAAWPWESNDPLNLSFLFYGNGRSTMGTTLLLVGGNVHERKDNLICLSQCSLCLTQSRSLKRYTQSQWFKTSQDFEETNEIKDVKCLTLHVTLGKCLFTCLQCLETRFFYLSDVDAQRTQVLG